MEFLDYLWYETIVPGMCCGVVCGVVIILVVHWTRNR